MIKDTYLGEASDPLSLNLYTYCHNEPLMYFDPTGHYDYSIIPVNMSPAERDRIDAIYDKAAAVLNKSSQPSTTSGKAKTYTSIANVHHNDEMIQIAFENEKKAEQEYLIQSIIEAYDIIDVANSKHNLNSLLRPRIDNLSFLASDMEKQFSAEMSGINATVEKLLMNEAFLSDPWMLKSLVRAYESNRLNSLNGYQNLKGILLSNPKYKRVIEKELRQREHDGGIGALSIVIDNASGVGQAKSIYEVVNGKDPVTGEKIGTFGRVLAGIGIAFPAIKGGKYFKYADETIDGLQSGTKLLSETSQVSAGIIRKSAGIAFGTGLKRVKRMMKGSHGNLGVIPEEVAAQLAGKEFKSFDEFRNEFWKAVANSPYAKEFNRANISRMEEGLAPIAAASQQYGQIKSYALHHINPIHNGGGVYNMNNIIVVTPRFHQEILYRPYHFGN